ncbi:VOC family protein [Pseudomonas sp. S31]|uniref:VOC family protein n=1 Tax=Pseudomonas sp. S31 TaxID=1564473 RepID=UPI001912776B|nr:VOC family protein [Pseudomonas sp. S31]
MSNLISKIHHVAYRCKDALVTARWYEEHLGMSLILSIAEDAVPSTGEADPYMHIFLDAGMGNVLAFFELPARPEMGRDPNTPEWTQHLAMEVDSLDTLLATKAKLESSGIKVLGPTDHALFKSIYFFDPSGHRLELVAPTIRKGMLEALGEVKWDMLEEWSTTKRAPHHAAWMHDGRYKQMFSEA